MCAWSYYRNSCIKIAPFVFKGLIFNARCLVQNGDRSELSPFDITDPTLHEVSTLNGSSDRLSSVDKFGIKMRKINSASSPIVRSTIFLILSLILISKSTHVYAHADHDKARYVSEDGIDAGKCDDPSAPCKSISYAGLQSNKGDRIRVAAGNYVIDDIDTLFYLLSDLVPVEGGYD